MVTSQVLHEIAVRKALIVVGGKYRETTSDLKMRTVAASVSAKTAAYQLVIVAHRICGDRYDQPNC